MSDIKILKIIVNQLPKRCGECQFREDHYCAVKGASVKDGQRWIDKYAENRDDNCPLKINDDIDYI